MRFGTVVTAVRRHGTKSQWQVVSRAVAVDAPGGGGGARGGGSGGAREVEVNNVETFDAVFCASGQYGHPKIPPDLLSTGANYTGRVRHSQEYRNGADLQGKRVLVVGVRLQVVLRSVGRRRRGRKRFFLPCPVRP